MLDSEEREDDLERDLDSGLLERDRLLPDSGRDLEDVDLKSLPPSPVLWPEVFLTLPSESRDGERVYFSTLLCSFPFPEFLDLDELDLMLGDERFDLLRLP